MIVNEQEFSMSPHIISLWNVGVWGKKQGICYSLCITGENLAIPPRAFSQAHF